MPVFAIGRDSSRFKLLMYSLALFIVLLVYTLAMFRFIQYYSAHYGKEEGE